MVWEGIDGGSLDRRLDLSSGSVGGGVARHLFDETPDHQDATTGGVLRITVSHVLYPVTKEVLHQILEVYGVEKMSVFERVNHVEAMVQLRSWQEAKQARDAFHGRCIYEGCCFLDILLVQPTPDSVSSTTARRDAEAFAIAPEVIVAGARSSPSDNGQDHVDTSIADSEVPVGDNSIKQATADVTEHEVISGDQDGMDVSTANEHCERGAGAEKSGIRVDYSNGEQTTAIAVKLMEQEVAAEEQDVRDCLLTNGNAGPYEAAEVFDVQGKEGSKVRFGAVSYNMVLDALGRNGRLDETLQLFDRMCREHDPPSRIAVNLGSFNVMVDAYCRAERFQDAIEVFGKMGEKRCAPDALSYNSLIDWLGKNKLVGEVEGLYKEMGERGVNPDEYTYVLLIESCFKVDRVDDAVGYFNKMFDAGLRPSANAFNKAIGGLVKVDRLDEAQGLFDRIPEKEVKPNIASYELLLRAYIDASRLDDAIKMVKGILLDDSVVFSDESKELLEGALEKEGRYGDMAKLYEDVEREKAEVAARAAEEKARAEALAKEEEERKKDEAKAKEEAAARASRAAIEAVLGRKREAEKDESADGTTVEDAQVVDSNSDAIGVTGERNEVDDRKKQESGDASPQVIGSSS